MCPGLGPVRDSDLGVGSVLSRVCIHPFGLALRAPASALAPLHCVWLSGKWTHGVLPSESASFCSGYSFRASFVFLCAPGVSIFCWADFFRKRHRTEGETQHQNFPWYAGVGLKTYVTLKAKKAHHPGELSCWPLTPPNPGSENAHRPHSHAVRPHGFPGSASSLLT